MNIRVKFLKQGIIIKHTKTEYMGTCSVFVESTEKKKKKIKDSFGKNRNVQSDRNKFQCVSTAKDRSDVNLFIHLSVKKPKLN